LSWCDDLLHNIYLIKVNTYKYFIYFILFSSSCILWSIGIYTTNNIIFFKKNFWENKYANEYTCDVTFYISDGFTISQVIILVSSIFSFFIGIFFVIFYFNLNGDIQFEMRCEESKKRELRTVEVQQQLQNNRIHIERLPPTDIHNMKHIRDRTLENENDVAVIV